jgi:hypothetical protein
MQYRIQVQIELGRLAVHYDIQPVVDGPVLNRHVRTYLAYQKSPGGGGGGRGGGGGGGGAAGGLMTRFFVRALVLGRAELDGEDAKSFIRLQFDAMLQVHILDRMDCA